jgi:hypothetical protein
MTIIRNAFGVAAAALLAGCAGNGNSATIGGQMVPSGDSISSAYTTTLNGTPQSEGVILLSSSTGMCSALSAGQQRPAAQLMLIALQDVDAGAASPPQGPGHYVIGATSSRTASLSYLVTDGNCQAAAQSNAVSGTVDLTSVSAGVYSGSFQATLDSGQAVSGSFSPTNCGELGVMLESSQHLSCK